MYCQLRAEDFGLNHVSLFSHQGSNVVVYSHFCGTVGELPEGFKGYPMFPGIDPEVLKGRSFKTMAIDIHEVLDGKIKKTWHFEDWLTALEQLLAKQKFTYLDRPILLEEGESMTKIYGQPPQAFCSLTEFIVPDFKFERRATLLFRNRITIMFKLSGTITNIEGFPELPMFPGIPSEKLLGKKFDTRAIYIQIIRDGKVKQEYWIKDWAAALNQILNGYPPSDFGLDEEFLKPST